MKHGFLLALITIVVLASCKKVIKPDPVYPDLPAYSEKGLNVGGILINDNPWLTEKTGPFNRIYPMHLFSYPTGDSIVIFLSGNYKDSSLTYSPPSTIFVVIKNVKIITDIDLVQLNGKSYNLDGNINYGGFSDYNGDYKVGRAVGNITFGKVSEMSRVTIGDGTPGNPVLHPYIVAGHLNMNLFTTTNYTLREGRFDVYIIRKTQFVVF